MGESVTAVLFDVDGTLIDSNYLHVTTWWEAFRQAGYDVAMLSGGIGRGELLEAGAAEVYDNPADLLARFPAGLLGAS